MMWMLEMYIRSVGVYRAGGAARASEALGCTNNPRLISGENSDEALLTRIKTEREKQTPKKKSRSSSRPRGSWKPNLYNE
jgi:hypothetical protein